MSQPVKLFVYDLSNGMARQLSRQLTGKQIDGIWHTSVVVFGKEIFYGQGINITAPGRSHHGTPLQVIDIGETALDEETLNEYLGEMREHYTADKYHLLDFNCNSFTNDCVGFLTGGSIPAFIKDLPTDFLSTPFGAALRPTIDSMYRGPSSGAPVPAPNSAAVTAASPDPQLASSLLQAVASRAAESGRPTSHLSTLTPTSPPTPATSTLTAPVHISTNPSSFHSLLRGHRALIAFFTSTTCGPCKMVEPVFEELAESKSRGDGAVAFTKIDLDVGLGGSVAAEWAVRVTPTFIFFLDGKKTHELKGVNAHELRTQVDLLIFQAFPPHPHTSLSLRAISSISLKPILFTQVPALDSALAKLVSFVDAHPSAASAQAKDTLSHSVIPYLKTRFPGPSSKPPGDALLTSWVHATSVLAETLPTVELFPLVDMWRLAFLDAAVTAWLVSSPLSSDPISIFLSKSASALATSQTSKTRNYILTVLRMLSNAFSNDSLGQRLLAPGRASSFRESLTSLLVTTLLHEDAAVRTAASSLAFNVATLLQKSRFEQGRQGPRQITANGDGDWEVELLSAVVEAIDREKSNEEVVYRLCASLALLLWLSPFYDTHHKPLLDVLQARTMLKNKLVAGGCGEVGVKRKEVRALVEECAAKLCP